MDWPSPRDIQLFCYWRKLYHYQNGALTQCNALLHLFTGIALCRA